MSGYLLLLCSACWLVCVAASPSPPTRFELEDAESYFENFIKTYNKKYADEDDKQTRFGIFKVNLEIANHLNDKSDHAVFGITQFMDLTHEEFLYQYTGFGRRDFDNDTDASCKILTDDDIPGGDVPASFDWREHNVVTPVKNQKTCGSCWAFSTIGNIEGQYALKHKQQKLFSEQQLVDCDLFNNGCHGGIMSDGFRALINMGGAQSEDDYPYANVRGKCKFDVNKVKVQLTDCHVFNLRSQEKLKHLLYHNGPISIAVTADYFHFYKGGVMSDTLCGTSTIDHAVLLVGYGTEDGKPYWLVKNSWGTGFGEEGYIKIQRGEGASSCEMMNEYMATSIVA